MKLRPVLMLGLWLMAGTILLASAQPPPLQDPAERPCDSLAGAAESGQPAGHAILATVTRVDQRQGRVEFITKAGAFVLTTPPAEIHDLRAGDHLLICLTGDVSDGAERVAEDEPAETSKIRDALTLEPDMTPEHRTTPLAEGRGPTRH